MLMLKKNVGNSFCSVSVMGDKSGFELAAVPVFNNYELYFHTDL